RGGICAPEFWNLFRPGPGSNQTNESDRKPPLRASCRESDEHMNHQRAIVDLLYEGYAGRKDHRVAPTVGLIRDRGVVVVVDPGMVPSPAAILDPLSALGLAAEDVTDVVFSHHHPDHTLSAALLCMPPSTTTGQHTATTCGKTVTQRASRFQRMSA